MKTKCALCLFGAVILLWSKPVDAATIVSPTGIVQNTVGDFSVANALDRTIDQSGLSLGFTSGTTDFDTYVAGNPTHAYIFTGGGAEWFSLEGSTSGSIGYDLGASFTIDRLALWNEEFSGIQEMTVFTANNAGFVGEVNVGTFNPVISPFDVDYGVQVFSLAPSTGQFVRLQLRGPQDPNRGNYLSMGEIAFSVGAVPEPATATLAMLGLGGLMMRRKRTA